MGIEDGEHESEGRDKQSLLQKYDVPIEHISYEYIGGCENAKEIERIIRILRSGEEGSYPHLESFAEERLRLLKPGSQLLRRAEPVLPRSCLDSSARLQLDAELGEWMRQMRVRDSDIAEEKSLHAADAAEPLPRPAVRSSSTASLQSPAPQKDKDKRLASCDYAAWDKFDADTELNRIDLQEERDKIQAKRLQEQQRIERSKTKAETVIEKSLLTSTELSVMSVREREKGNEAFRAKDFEEALQLYSTSIAMDGDVNSYNNRAMTYIKLKNYEKAVRDCDAVLSIESMNIKALLRRGLSYEHLGKYTEALRDYEEVLQLDPSNAIASSHVDKLREKDETKPVRLTIEEIYDS